MITQKKFHQQNLGYKSPKKGPKWDKNKKGWVDKGGNVWVPDNWDVQYPRGGYDNVYPDGHVRKGKGGRGQFSPSNFNILDNSLIDGLNYVNNAIHTYKKVQYTFEHVRKGLIDLADEIIKEVIGNPSQQPSIPFCPIPFPVPVF